MSNIINSDVIFLLFALFVCTFLGFLIGWLMKSVKINTLKKSLDTCYKDIENLKNKIKSDSHYKDFDVQIKALRKASFVDKKLGLKDIKELKIASTYKPSTLNKSSIQFIKEEIEKALGKPIKENDLTVIKGISPKIEEILNQDGIKTWKKLSKAPVSRLQKILKKAGDRFLFHKPETWPKQALLAADGKWQELKKFQDYSDRGKEPS